MMDGMSFFLSWFLVLTLVGAGLYVFDRIKGVKIYRWWYDMTHEHPLPADVEKGFLYNRKSQSRFALAIVLSLVQSAIALFHEASTLPQELLSMLIEIPCLMFGFYLGPTLYRVWARREKVFETVDQIESGKISIQNEVKEMSQSALAKIKSAVATEKPEEPAGGPKPLEAPLPPEPEEEPEPDPKALMDKYLNR
ncbi:MAG: hypothetical protein U0136_10370 [Bdellovibrionota bacterium]